MQEELGKAQWCPNGLLYKDLIDASADNIEWLVDECGCQLDGLIDNYPCGATSGKVDSFHWWKDGAATWATCCPCSSSCATQAPTSA